ncbi:MAG: hypothetical protein A2X02_01995 [Bacteroidetes bacterium GWF2_29_10]|nr:MAG: hypothetical protein A2X02_01995 [Bacteroidetes bacterium GWF2_29_10]
MKKILLLFVMAFAIMSTSFAQFNKYDKEQVFGVSDSIIQSWDFNDTINFYYPVFGHNEYGDIGFAEKYNVTKTAKVKSVFVLFGGIKLTNQDKNMYAFVLDKDRKLLGGSKIIQYKDIKLNNTSVYPNNGEGYTRFDFDSIVEVAGEYYVGVFYDDYTGSTSLDDEIIIASTKDGVRGNNYSEQNIYYNFTESGDLAYGDISSDFGVSINLAIGVKLDFCDVVINAGSDLTVCSGDSVLLNATFTGSYLTNPIVAWSDSIVDNNYIIGNNIKGIVTSSKKLYVTIVTDECMAYDSLYITVKTDCNPNVCDLTASITKTVNTTTVTLDALPNIGATYNWNTGATTQNITINKPTENTTYYVTVTKIGTTCTATATMVVLANDNGACNISASISKTVNNDKSVTLTAFPSLDATYLWSTNATTQSITVNPTTTATTNYTVTVTKIGTTCTSIATTAITSLNEIEQIKASLSVYPMPINEQLNISFDMVNSGNVNIIISDITGRIIYNETVKSNGTSVNKNINTENIANGVYTLKIETLNGNIVKKIIKN